MPSFAKISRDVPLPVNYDQLTQAERARVRAQYVRLQNGKCKYCKQALSEQPFNQPRVDRSRFPRGFFLHPVHLHHNHRTGMTIGAVHALCNAVLWQYHGE